MRRDTAHVMSLDDRLLADIGLSRGSFERCFRSGAANDNWCPNPPPRSVPSPGQKVKRQPSAAQPAPEKRKMPAHVAGIHLA